VEGFYIFLYYNFYIIHALILLHSGRYYNYRNSTIVRLLTYKKNETILPIQDEFNIFSNAFFIQNSLKYPHILLEFHCITPGNNDQVPSSQSFRHKSKNYISFAVTAIHSTNIILYNTTECITDRGQRFSGTSGVQRHLLVGRGWPTVVLRHVVGPI